MTSFIPSWYPGHMRKFTRMLPELLSKADFVLELRDSRLPLTSVNGAFETALHRWRFDRVKTTEYFVDPKSTAVSSQVSGGYTTCEHVIVMNKSDLVPDWGIQIFKDAMKAKYPHQKLIFASTKKHKDIKGIHDMIVNIARHEVHRYTGLNVLVVGMPNVGKSTLLNALRNLGIQGPTPKAFSTSSHPGMTRSVGTRVKLCEDPLVYSLDTPGVMLPYLGSGKDGAEKGLKLAAIAGLKEGLLDNDSIVYYIMQQLNFFHPTKPAYLSILPPGSVPLSTTDDLLEALAQRLGMVKRGGILDRERAAAWFVQWWREEGCILSASDPPSDHPLLPSYNPLVPSGQPIPLTLTGGWGLDFTWNVLIEGDTFKNTTVREIIKAEMEKTIGNHMRMVEAETNGEQLSKSQLAKREKDKLLEKRRLKAKQMMKIKRQMNDLEKGRIPRKKRA